MTYPAWLTRFFGKKSKDSADGRRPDPRHELGRVGESAAADYLRKQGYTIIDRNVRLRGGEIDILAQPDDRTLVCVEVKTRSRDDYRGEWAINRRKKMQLIQLTQRLARRRRFAGLRLRIDVIVVVMREGRVDELRHHKSAVTLDR